MTNTATSTAVLQWTLGDRLGKALRVAGCSVQEMADVLGVSRNTVGNYVADRTPITDGYVRLWAMRTGVSFQELKTGIPSPDGPDSGVSPLSDSNRRPPLYKSGALAN
jgi:transcriptional regulator with XRE-family HTH domain